VNPRVAVLVLLLALPACAEYLLRGRVVRILDGDTVDLLVAGARTERIRLEGIDAPEKGQAFGTQARKRLASLLFLRDVQVRLGKRDRYQRWIGRIRADGEDINRRLLLEGMAWHFVQYAHEQPVAEREADARAEAAARAARRGIWGDREPVPPWAWRKRRK
jgi:endonuclease YncB( thermonuclease family)